MNPNDDQRLRQRLHEEFGALEISPAPVLRVTARGRGVRARRRALAAGTTILTVLAVVAAAHLNGRATAPPVTLNQPNPAAPGGVFASGTADGKPWALAVRNIAAAPGTRWCLPAVMLNGHSGDVLFKGARGTPTFGNPAFLAYVPGFRGLSAMFTQVAPGQTRLVGTFPGGRSITARAVWVRACGISVQPGRVRLRRAARPHRDRHLRQVRARRRPGRQHRLRLGEHVRSHVTRSLVEP